MIKKKFPVLLSLLLLLLTASAAMGQSERKLAKMFVSQAAKGIPVTVSPPPFLYKYNLKTGLLDTLSYASVREKDSLLWIYSDYIRKIDDSVFISNFMKGYLSELKKYGFHIVTDLSDTSRIYRISVAQIELDEQYYHFADTAYYGNDVYVHPQLLNALDVNAWFVIKGPLIKKKTGEVLFAENLLTDHLEGHFDVDPYSGKIKYLYTLDSLTIKKIYKYTQNLGRTYAGYTFDYLLNQYISKNISSARRTQRYWRYDPYRKKFFFAYDDRFVPLNNR